MAETGRRSPSDSSSIIKAAEWLGRTLGDWRRRRSEARDDQYIRMWKRAWTQGCDARWHGGSRDQVPFSSGPEHDAWLAGWNWADIQPDRRDPTRAVSLAHARRRAADLGEA